MRQFFVSNDPDVRAVTELDNGDLIAWGNAGGKIDTRNSRQIGSFQELSDDARISERSHLPDPTLERVIGELAQTLNP